MNLFVFRVNNFAACLVAVVLLAGLSWAAEREPVTAAVSLGDSIFNVHATPVDSKLSIETYMKTIAEDFGVDRVWWRGQELAESTFVLRDLNRRYHRFWEWAYHLNAAGVDKLAIEAAHEQGMKIWFYTGLFQFGASADAQWWPQIYEDKLRVEHPEWIPVNKWGTRHQAGNIAFCYPEARKALVKRWADFLIASGYDGIIFYTYNENKSMRYVEEFGYNQPIVDEYQKRYGVDIRKEKFDRELWAKLRGEYVTQFLKELHEALAPHDIQIGVWLDAEDSHLPQRWPSGDFVRTTGRILMDWETWAKENYVDELSLYWVKYEGGSYGSRKDAKAWEILDQCIKATEDTGVKLSLSYYPNAEKLPPGVTRVVILRNAVESGYAAENYLYYPGLEGENTPLEPASVLTGDDPKAKRRALYLAAPDGGRANEKPKIELPFELVQAALKDPDLYVRLRAIKALRLMKNPEAVPALEEALFDPENSVRCRAAQALGDFNAPGSISKIFESSGKFGRFQFDDQAARKTLVGLGNENINAIVSQLDSTNPRIRLLASDVLRDIRIAPEVDEALRKAAKDKVAGVRENAVWALTRYRRSEEALKTVREALDDPDFGVRIRAAQSLPAFDAIIPREEIEATLVDFYKRIGDGSDPQDDNWGYRVLGKVILNFGETGKNALAEIMKTSTNSKLVENTWRVLYIPQKFDGWSFVTEQEDETAHQFYPVRNIGQ